jgi:hypothetical protein
MPIKVCVVAVRSLRHMYGCAYVASRNEHSDCTIHLLPPEPLTPILLTSVLVSCELYASIDHPYFRSILSFSRIHLHHFLHSRPPITSPTCHPDCTIRSSRLILASTSPEKNGYPRETILKKFADNNRYRPKRGQTQARRCVFLIQRRVQS